MTVVPDTGRTAMTVCEPDGVTFAHEAPWSVDRCSVPPSEITYNSPPGPAAQAVQLPPLNGVMGVQSWARARGAVKATRAETASKMRSVRYSVGRNRGQGMGSPGFGPPASPRAGLRAVLPGGGALWQKNYPSSKFLLWAHSRVAACGSRAMSNTSAGCPTAKYEALSRAFRSHEAGTADAPRRVRLTGWLLYDSYVGQIPLAL